MSTFAPFSALVGAAVTALVSYLIYRRGLQERVARELLSEALEEAGIVQGYDESASKIGIHEHPDLKEEKDKEPASREWLRRVEVRAVLDEEYWNAPQNAPYGFIGARRAWIVRRAHSRPHSSHGSGKSRGHQKRR